MDQHKQSPKRHYSDPPTVIAEWGWRYHHLGVTTNTAPEGEEYLKAFKKYVSGVEASPYGIDWMRFEESSPDGAPIELLQFGQKSGLVG